MSGCTAVSGGLSNYSDTDDVIMWKHSVFMQYKVGPWPYPLTWLQDSPWSAQLMAANCGTKAPHPSSSDTRPGCCCCTPACLIWTRKSFSLSILVTFCPFRDINLLALCQFICHFCLTIECPHFQTYDHGTKDQRNAPALHCSSQSAWPRAPPPRGRISEHKSICCKKLLSSSCSSH